MRTHKLAEAGIVILMIVGSSPKPVCLGAGQAEEKVPVGALAGRVVDTAGNPVPKATVWLVGGPYDSDVAAVDETVTDAQGGFRFPEAESGQLKTRGFASYVSSGFSAARFRKA